MDNAYRLAMQEQLAELNEELQHIHDIVQQQGHMPTLVYRACERNPPSPDGAFACPLCGMYYNYVMQLQQ